MKDFEGNFINKSGDQNGMWSADVNWNTWGKELTAYIQGLICIVLVNDKMFIVWLASTNEIAARAVWDNTTKKGQGRLDFSEWHFLRTGQKLTVKCDNTSVIKIIA